jgi:hypothetical protein
VNELTVIPRRLDVVELQGPTEAQLHAEIRELKKANVALVAAQRQLANGVSIKLAAARMVLMRFKDDAGVRGVLDTFTHVERQLAEAEKKLLLK